MPRPRAAVTSRREAGGERLQAGGWRLQAEAAGGRLQAGGWRLEAAGGRREAVRTWIYAAWDGWYDGP